MPKYCRDCTYYRSHPFHEGDFDIDGLCLNAEDYPTTTMEEDWCIGYKEA